MLLTLVSIEDPSIEKAIEIPNEIVRNNTRLQSTELTQKPQKNRQTSKSIIHG